MTEVGVADHRELGARYQRAPGSISGTVTLYMRGPDGQPSGDGLAPGMDAQGQLTGPAGTPIAGLLFGTLPPEAAGSGVLLAPGLQAVLSAQGSGFVTRTQEEADLVASLLALGRDSQEIQAALDSLRSQGVVVRGVLTGSLTQLTEDERNFVTELLDLGINVEVVDTGLQRTPDFKINGVTTELKTLSQVEIPDDAAAISDKLSSALSSRILDGRGQSTTVIVDARSQIGMTQEIAQRGIGRALGADRITGGKLENITVITQDGTAKYRKLQQ